MLLTCLKDQPLSLVHIFTMANSFLTRTLALRSLEINDESIQPNFSCSQRLPDKLVLLLLRSTSLNLLCHELENEEKSSFIFFSSTQYVKQERGTFEPLEIRKKELRAFHFVSSLQFFILNPLEHVRQKLLSVHQQKSSKAHVINSEKGPKGLMRIVCCIKYVLLIYFFGMLWSFSFFSSSHFGVGKFTSFKRNERRNHQIELKLSCLQKFHSIVFLPRFLLN